MVISCAGDEEREKKTKKHTAIIPRELAGICLGFTRSTSLQETRNGQFEGRVSQRRDGNWTEEKPPKFSTNTDQLVLAHAITALARLQPAWGPCKTVGAPRMFLASPLIGAREFPAILREFCYGRCLRRALSCWHWQDLGGAGEIGCRPIAHSGVERVPAIADCWLNLEPTAKGDISRRKRRANADRPFEMKKGG